MNNVTLDTLKPNISFTSDLYIGTNFLLLPQNAIVTDELIAALKEWNFKDFTSEGTVSLGNDINVTDKKQEEETENREDETNNAKLKEAIANSKKIKFGNSDNSRMEAVQGVYNEYMNYINTLYTHYVTHKKISQTGLSETVKDLIIFIRENKRYMLRITPSAEARNKNYLVAHSMRSTVLAITIGLEQHLPLSKLIELGEACILHEIGMVRLPPQLYMTDKKLNPSEKKQVMTHTLLGYNIVKDLNFPASVQLGVLEHHEKENGTGYPRQLTSDKIISYAKIIAVACTFEAISAPRSYKEDRSTFDAMVEMLKNENKQYDDAVIKALLYSVSLFPIGAYVFLKNGKVALVTDVNPDNPKQPIVQLLMEKEKDGSPKTIQTNNAEYAIVRVLSKKETEDVKASLAKKLAEEEKAAQNKEKALEAAAAKQGQNESGTPEEAKKESSNEIEDVDISFFN